MNKITAVLISIIVTSLIWLTAIQEIKNNNLREMEKNVVSPTQTIIRDLKSTALMGNYEDLEIKLKLLENKWYNFFPDGDTPLEFVDIILAAGSETKKKMPLANGSE